MAGQRAAGNAKQPKQENRKGNALLTLEKLPRKIISLILATMAVDPNEPYVLDRSTLEPSATRKERDASARRDLASLCLASKRMASEAEPALYRNILICDSDTLVCLYRTFLEKPQFGRLAKRMTLDVCHGANNEVGGIKIIGTVPNVYLGSLLSYPKNEFGTHLIRNGGAEIAVENFTPWSSKS